MRPDEACVALELQEHQAESEERWIGLGLLPPKIETWFSLEDEPYWHGNRHYPETERLEVDFRLSPDRRVY